MSYLFNEIEQKVEQLLKDGAVGLLPTDTIYGLSALALNKDAVERVHKLKQRDGGKPLVVLISEIEQLASLGLSHIHATLLKKHWPGPLSVEFDASDAPEWLHRGKFYFAVRLPDNDSLRNLIRKIGPIVSSSANLQGKEPAKTVADAKNYFGDKLDFYVDKGELNGCSSTLVKIEEGKLNILRQGTYEIKTGVC
jgi:L-threonylcarbamoyladenylate synthase